MTLNFCFRNMATSSKDTHDKNQEYAMRHNRNKRAIYGGSSHMLLKPKFTHINMVVNPWIIDKINKLNVPDKIKKILIEFLEMQDELNTSSGSSKNFKVPYKKILEKYADDEEVKRFSADYE